MARDSTHCANPKVDRYIAKAQQWQEALQQLRTIVLDRQLTEELKWSIPVYTFENKNVVAISTLKGCCVLSFFQGALLKNARQILTKPGENTRAARVVRFTNVREIAEQEPILKAYIDEAIEIEKAGLRVDYQAHSKLSIPDEFQRKLDALPNLKTAFGALTPGRQRAYVLFFSGAKQSKTRTSRVEQYTQRILDGKGLNDCTCGHSQKLPACDGSHKHFR